MLIVDPDLGTQELVDLYDSVGWVLYTRDPQELVKAIRGSSFVVCERDDGGLLLGLARGLSDDVSIFYLQDILVRPSHQRRGIGSRLLSACLERFEHVRQKVLLTDDDRAQHALYSRLGYVRVNEYDQAPLNAYVRFDS